MKESIIEWLWDNILKYKDIILISSAIITILTIFFKPWRWIMSIINICKDKREINIICKLAEMEIVLRMKNPECKIAVNLQSLKERFPFKKEENLHKALLKLGKDKDKLFDEYNINSKSFYYMGDPDKRKYFYIFNKI